MAPSSGTEAVTGIELSGDSTEVRLLREAARLFRRQGYTKTSTRELATAVGLQSASLYHYMKSKEDLLLAICLKGYDLMLGSVQEAADKASGADTAHAIELAIEAHLRTAIDNRDFYLTTLAEAKSLSPRSRREVDKKSVQYSNLLLNLIEQAQQGGQLRTDVSSEHLMLVLRNQLSWTTFWFKRDGELSIEEFAALIYRIFMEGAHD